ncbi:MAG: hypothetical protein ISQ14_00640 [Verrucomicrobiae bacterium]|nr:hypothetical protein [Verrucomicrobiae bacterium]
MTAATLSDLPGDARILFTDGSTNPALRIGVGAAMAVPRAWLERDADQILPDEVAALTVSRRFTDTSSTRLELETVLWAMREHAPGKVSLALGTDSQCVAGLPARRERLEATAFVSGASGAELRHADLYREFYRELDRRPVALFKLAGHADYRYQEAAQRIFHFVDREARRQLKRWMRELDRAA